MSLNGLNNTVFPLTIDGTTALDVSSLTIDGTNIDIAGLVPYTGATQTLDMGTQNIKTSHTPVANEDVINLITLQNAVTFVDNSIALTYLNKITSNDQTVAGKVTYTKELDVTNEKPVTLGNQVVVGPNYPLSTVSSATVTVSQHFGSITNSGGVYQATTDIASGTPILIGFPITNGKKYRFTVEFLIEDPTYTWFVEAYQSVDNINAVAFGVIGTNVFPANTSVYTTIDYTFDAVTTGNVIFPTTNDAPPPTISNQAVKWKNLVVYEQGVALAKVTIPSLTADRVAVFDESHRLVSSGINVTKLGYLDNVSSDIQTQLNSKLSNTSGQAFGTFDFTSTVPILFSGFNGSRALITNASKQLAESAVTSTELGYVSGVTSAIQGQLNAKLSLTGGTMTGALVMGANKVTTSYVPVNGEDLTNKTYVDGAITGAGALYVLKAGDTMTGNLTLSGTGTTAGVEAKRYYLSARGDNQDDVAGDNVYGPWYGLGDSGITGFIGKPCLTGYYGCALRSGLGYMVVAENGNVGIGTTDPKTQLTVARDIAYADRASNPFKAQTTIKSSTNGQRLYLGAYYTGGEGSCSAIQSSDFYSELDHGANLLLNPLGGIVGIGTDPTSLLHLYNATEPLITLQLNTVDYSYISANADLFLGANVKSGGTGIKNGDRGTASIRLVPEAYDGGYMTFSTSDDVNEAPTERMRITKTGRVGINKTAPEGDLHVQLTGAVSDYWGKLVVKTTSFWGDGCSTRSETAGTQYATMFPMMFLTPHIVSDTDGWCYIRYGRAGGVSTGRWWETAVRADGFFQIGVERSNQLTINPNGNVGIGGDPTSKLDVQGTISTPARIAITNGDPGDLISKRYGSADRYGIGQYNSGTVRVFGSNTYNGTSIRFSLATDDTTSGSAGFNDLMTMLYKGVLDIKGGNGGGTWAQERAVAGALVIGRNDTNYGGSTSTSSTNMGGIIMECADNTEIAVHDAGTRVASFMYYQGAQNFISIGRDMGWGAIGYVLVPSSLIANRISVVADDANGRLNVRNPNGSTTHFGYSDNRNYIRNNTIFDTGYVEIGSSYVWRAPLDITTAVGRDNGCVRYFDVWGGLGYTCNWYSYSAMADTWGGSRFMAYSDARKKKNIKTVSTALKDIQGLRIVSYDHIDHVQPHNYWGVIAQEIEEQYPYLISQGKEFLPNIFIEALAHQCSKCGDFVWLEMTVLVDSNHVGKLVKIITYDEEGKTEYEETTTIVAVEDFRMKVKVWKKQDEVRYESKERVFVYGTCEEDVRTVDKTQFGLLAVAGVQEQQKMIEEQRKRLAVLEAREAVWEQYAREQEAKQKKMEERMEKMASLLSQLMKA